MASRVPFPKPGLRITGSPLPGHPGAWNCEVVAIFKVVTDPDNLLPGGTNISGPQIHSVCVCVRCAHKHMHVHVGWGYNVICLH